MSDSSPTDSDSKVAKVHVALKGEDLSFARDVDEPTALEILALLMGGGAPATPRHKATGAAPAPHRPGPGSPGLSLREKLDAANAKRWPDKIVVIGQHLHDTGKNSFAKNEIRGLYPAAGEKKAGNYPRDFAWTVRNGWVSPLDGSSKDFYVTQKGRDAISKRFSTEVTKATAQPKAARRRKKSDVKGAEAAASTSDGFGVGLAVPRL